MNTSLIDRNVEEASPAGSTSQPSQSEERDEDRSLELAGSDYLLGC